MNYQPTHVHKTDGSPAMLVYEPLGNNRLCIMENEDGYQWPDVMDDFQPIRREPEPLPLGEFKFNLTPNIGAYEAERWRAISDELLGQIQRLRAISKTRAEWQAIECLDSASRSLFGAFGAVVREARDADTSTG